MSSSPPLKSGTDLLLVNTPLKDYSLSPRRNTFTLPTLGLGYIATCAERAGFSVDVLDAEALGLPLSEAAALINHARPRWVGLNLLAPTYPNSVTLLRLLHRKISVMLGGHQAKAMPRAILEDFRIPRLDALVLGEAETRVPRLLDDVRSRGDLPRVYWRDENRPMMPVVTIKEIELLAPDLNSMPLLDRRFLAHDPYPDDGTLEAAMVASRGCPFDCSFCGAAVSANPDVTVRRRRPESIVAEMSDLKLRHGVTRVRFVDDLFLAGAKPMRRIFDAFVSARIDMRWDATGRVNVLADADDGLLELMANSGCREVALGIETGSDRLLSYIGKKITVEQTIRAVTRLCATGVDVKGYFILGLPSETRDEHRSTMELIRRLWTLTEGSPGRFRCSVFEYRPYPGTPDWERLVAAGYSPEAMLDYGEFIEDEAVDSDREEFNFSTGLQFGEMSVEAVRENVSMIMREQRSR